VPELAVAACLFMVAAGVVALGVASVRGRF